ncbi:hypothetical protein PUN28_017024 [Cardiocondyla obscurior]|uniref:Uncharacterized protein n=1 Tax=Cardiocondyla obscurior TaxID=286306 RepID=A0AAW2EP83_9HYME
MYEIATRTRLGVDKEGAPVQCCSSRDFSAEAEITPPRFCATVQLDYSFGTMIQQTWSRDHLKEAKCQKNYLFLTSRQKRRHIKELTVKDLLRIENALSDNEEERRNYKDNEKNEYNDSTSTPYYFVPQDHEYENKETLNYNLDCNNQLLKNCNVDEMEISKNPDLKQK